MGNIYLLRDYKIYGGSAYDGDIVSDYLTDSTNFRIFIGKYDNAHESHGYIYKDDSVVISFKERIDTSIVYRTTSQKRYSISSLKKKNIFE
jgi:hypothetical protein